MESGEFKECVSSRGLKKTVVDAAVCLAELDVADGDLKLARTSLASGSAGWAVVQCYYACFHAARALVMSEGFVEKSHRCLSIAFRDLFEREKLVEQGSANFLDEMRQMREEFNYGLKQISPQETLQIIGRVEGFVAQARNALGASSRLKK